VAIDSCHGDCGQPDLIGIPSMMVPVVPPGACIAGTIEGYAAFPFFMVGAAAIGGGHHRYRWSAPSVVTVCCPLPSILHAEGGRKPSELSSSWLISRWRTYSSLMWSPPWGLASDATPRWGPAGHSMGILVELIQVKIKEPTYWFRRPQHLNVSLLLRNLWRP